MFSKARVLQVGIRKGYLTLKLLEREYTSLDDYTTVSHHTIGIIDLILTVVQAMSYLAEHYVTRFCANDEC